MQRNHTLNDFNMCTCCSCFTGISPTAFFGRHDLHLAQELPVGVALVQVGEAEDEAAVLLVVNDLETHVLLHAIDVTFVSGNFGTEFLEKEKGRSKSKQQSKKLNN